MEPERLYLESGKPTEAHICGKCRRVWDSKDSAERCCTCSYCRQYCDWTNSSTAHEECSRAQLAKTEMERLDAAVLQPNYDGPFLWNDRVYQDAAEFLDSVDLEDLPDFGYCTTYEAPVLNADDIVESLADSMHEDWEPEGMDELFAAVNAWNEANEKNGSYWEDWKRKWSKAALLAAAEGTWSKS